MAFVGSVLISLLAAAVLIQLAWLFVQVLASSQFYSGCKQSVHPRLARVCVIIPAHNEAISIANTITAIKPQLHEIDRLLVVADNCDDQTAAIAVQHGAEVIERHDKLLLGKGYALDYAVKFIGGQRAPEVVIFVDADCVLAPGSVDELARICISRQRPAQATNLMVAPESAGSRAKVAQFAWKVKNYVRPLGSRRLGFPCQITGTGMAFPWSLISRAELATNHIVEDMKLGVELMIAGHDPVFCPAARVTSKFPSNQDGSRIQRTRWEHGHLMIILEYAPRLLRAAYQKRSLELLVMAIDLSIPPLGLMAVLTLVLAVAGLSVVLAGAPKVAFALATAPMFLLGATIGVAWLRHGRDLLNLGDMLAIPAYVFSKIPMLWGFVIRRQTVWVRSLRDTE
jgi:cellulose synthase/poly-beta-1,6-N-acetylglucosamine synthase-like glycosyltransferase